MLIVDSWGGQTKAQIYDEDFTNDSGKPTCRNFKYYSSKMHSISTAVWLLFLSTMKQFIKRLPNCTYLFQKKEKYLHEKMAKNTFGVTSSAPIFQPMLKYAWFVSGLTGERSVFLNLKQVCFELDSLKQNCNCSVQSFMYVRIVENVFSLAFKTNIHT